MKLLTSEWVTPDFDKTVKYKVRGMNGIEYMKYGRFPPVENADGDLIVSDEAAEIALKAVKDWDGVKGGDGNPASFSYAALLESADLTTTIYLLGEIMNRTKVDGNTEKN